MKKIKPLGKTVGQFSSGGKNKMMPFWVEKTKTVFSKPPIQQTFYTKSQKITITIDWGNLLFWFALILTIYLLN